MSRRTVRVVTRQLQTEAQRRQRRQHVQRTVHSGRLVVQRQQLRCMDTRVRSSKSSRYPQQLPSPPLLSPPAAHLFQTLLQQARVVQHLVALRALQRRAPRLLSQLGLQGGKGAG